MNKGNTQYKIVFRDRKQVPSKLYMTCPSCGSHLSTTSHTSAAYSGNVYGIGRQRKCHKCSKEYRTIEVSEQFLIDMGVPV